MNDNKNIYNTSIDDLLNESVSLNNLLNNFSEDANLSPEFLDMVRDVPEGDIKKSFQAIEVVVQVFENGGVEIDKNKTIDVDATEKAEIAIKDNNAKDILNKIEESLNNENKLIALNAMKRIISSNDYQQTLSTENQDIQFSKMKDVYEKFICQDTNIDVSFETFFNSCKEIAKQENDITNKTRVNNNSFTV